MTQAEAGAVLERAFGKLAADEAAAAQAIERDDAERRCAFFRTWLEDIRRRAPETCAASELAQLAAYAAAPVARRPPLR